MRTQDFSDLEVHSLFTKKTSRSNDSGEWSDRIGTAFPEEVSGASVELQSHGLIHSVGSSCASPAFQSETRPPQPFPGARTSWSTRMKALLCCFYGRRSSSCGARLGDPCGMYASGRSCTIGPPAKEDEGKVTLVLDLDETLLHASFVPVANADWVVPVEMEGMLLHVYIVKRPWVDYFFSQIGESFEVVVFTASLSKYADPVLDLLDPGGRVKWRLYRENCVLFNGNFVKNIGDIGRPLARTVIVDNSPHSYAWNEENALPIKSFIDDPEDRGLLDLLPKLLKLEGCSDVRTELQKLNCA